MTVDGFSQATVELTAGQVSPQFIAKHAHHGKGLVELAHLNNSGMDGGRQK